MRSYKQFSFFSHYLRNVPRNNFSSALRDKIKSLIPTKQKEWVEFKQKYGDKVVDQYTVAQVIGGMRGIKGIFQDISKVDPLSGVLFKGYTIPQLVEFLPKKKEEPLPEGCLWLLMTGELPKEKDVQNLQIELRQKAQISNELLGFITSLPRTFHPMTMLSLSILYLQNDSVFAKKYAEGTISKSQYWPYFYEDAMNLIAKIPRIAAIIYRHKYHNGNIIEADESLDWASNYAHMMGFEDEIIKECIRGYLTIHSDHEGGNVSAHTTHLVGSALSDPYLSYSAGLNGLAGPLHGLANQEVLKWIMDIREKYNSYDLNDKQVSDYVDECFKKGKVIPGYGHAVLRNVDPRFTHQQQFSEKYLKNEPLIKLLHRCASVIPKHILENYKKVKNPYPNVDAHSGVLLYTLGMKEYDYYTVVFAVSRSLGCMSNLVWSRIYGLAIERPASVDFNWLHHKFRE